MIVAIIKRVPLSCDDCLAPIIEHDCGCLECVECDAVLPCRDCGRLP